MAAVAHRATVHRRPLMGKARRADIVIFYNCSELGKNHDTVGPLGLKKSWKALRPGDFVPRHPLCRPAGPEEPLAARWAGRRVGGLCNRGTSSPGIHSAGPLGLKNHCRTVGLKKHCRPAGAKMILQAYWPLK